MCKDNIFPEKNNGFQALSGADFLPWSYSAAEKNDYFCDHKIESTMIRQYAGLVKFAHTIFAMPFALVGFVYALRTEGISSDCSGRYGWVVLLLQVLLFGHIHLFGYATPMPYVYFLIILSLDTPRWLYLVSAFALGLAIDIFSCTPGMTSASLCAVALIAPWLLEKFRPSDKESEDFSPSARSMKWGGFLRYAALLILLNCIFYFTIEAFSFTAWKLLLVNIGASFLLTFLVVLALELLRSRH